VAAVQHDPDITRPWLEYLFTRTFDYPMPLAGIPDYLNTGTTRDGTSWIGSWFYSAAGGRGLEIAPLLSDYVEASGATQYDLTDFREYPKVLTSCQWSLENRVAGTYPMQIGDVNGPTVDYLHWFDSGAAAMRLGWQWTQDPRFAFFLKYYWGRETETEEQWNAIEHAAATVPRHPWFANRSRVLSQWAGVLESGTEHDDFRFRRAVTIRVGLGYGHAQNDTLDLNLFAHGCVLAASGGQRPAYGVPPCPASFTHNLVEVNGTGHHREASWTGHSWIRTLADVPGSAFLTAESVPPETHPDVNLYRRHVALIDVDEGKPSASPTAVTMIRPDTKLPRDVVTPNSYVFDVFRVAGGRVHTYCFHGGQNDELTHNVADAEPVAAPEPEHPSFEQSYLRKWWIAPEHKWSGTGSDHVQATWRLSREPREFAFDGNAYAKQLGGYSGGKVSHTFKSTPAEQANLKANYDPDAPTKHTRLHVLGQPDARVLGAMWASPKSRNHFDQLFVQKRTGEPGPPLESVFVAVIEPYAGNPILETVRQLSVDQTTADALRAVAVELQTRNGHRDVLFSDGRPGNSRKVGDLELSGEFAYVSTDTAGLRLATVVGGNKLATPEISLELSTAEYRAEIVRIDYLERTATLSTSLPAQLLDGTFFEVGTDVHRTSLETTDVDGQTLHFRKSPEIVTSRVLSIDESSGVLEASLGLPPGGLVVRGMADGLTAATDDRTQLFRCTYLGGSRERGYRYKLSGAPVRKTDFPRLGTLRILEFGPGDVVRAAAWASVRRTAPNTLELTANVPVTVRFRATTAEYSADGKRWHALRAQTKDGWLTTQLTEVLLGSGRLRLRTK